MTLQILTGDSLIILPTLAAKSVQCCVTSPPYWGFGSNRTVRLTMGHIIDKSKGGNDTPQNLRAVCTNCNEGLQNTALQKPDRIHLLTQIRRATIQDQQIVLDWLLQKFGLETKKIN